ncbi:MAG TPA: putative PEP-binding protein, partial [Dehalococcoidia bacterium]
RAKVYRRIHKIPDDLGTGVNVQAMVFGNTGPDSGTGVMFTRNPSTGARELYGEYLPNAQGEDVVAGIRTPKKVAHLAAEAPEIYRQLLDIAKSLERRYRDIQDIEFTIERGKLYILQTRNAKRTAPAAVKVAVDLAEEGLIDRQEAVLRVEPSDIVQLLLPRFDPQAKDEAVAQRRRIARGLNASPGAATGKAVFDADRAVALADRGEAVILVRPETNPDDVHGILRAGGVLTSRGGITSHAAVVTRGLGKPCIVGAEEIKVDLERRELRVEEVVIREGEEISIDGTTGEVFAGAIRTVMPELMENRELLTLLSWADGFRTLGVLANADYPTDAAQARALGAEGIGLCRTEHMFFETDRLPYVREMLINAPEATRLEEAVQDVRSRLEAAAYPNRPALEQELAAAERARDASPAVRRYSDALARLAEFQMDDFSGILEAMAGRPVVIRLLDMPLHEFLPNHDDLLRDVTRLRTAGGDEGELARKEEMLRLVESLREANPMLGHRGCRLGLTYPGVYEMQVRAIMAAACRLKQHGMDVRPEIMIPLVSHVNELKQLRARLEAVARETMEQMGVEVHYRFGTMIEVPRAALTAGEIAAEAEFFSFGSNDLTQMTFGFSRDDAEGKFLGFYREHGILANNPFQVLDRSGVGRLIRVATEEGRRTRPELTVGLCGEHGGDPSSIAFCQEAGLTYVSASPFRVPVARLAAAQVALGKKFEEVQREA